MNYFERIVEKLRIRNLDWEKKILTKVLVCKNLTKLKPKWPLTKFQLLKIFKNLHYPYAATILASNFEVPSFTDSNTCFCKKKIYIYNCLKHLKSTFQLEINIKIWRPTQVDTYEIGKFQPLFVMKRFLEYITFENATFIIFE